MDDINNNHNQISKLRVDGKSCRIYRDSRNRQATGAAYLIDYYAVQNDQAVGYIDETKGNNEDIHLFISRFDARALLDEATLLDCEGSYSNSNSSKIDDSDEERNELEFERYRSLPGIDMTSNSAKIDTNSLSIEKDVEVKAQETFEIQNVPSGIKLVSLSLWDGYYVNETMKILSFAWLLIFPLDLVYNLR